MGPVGEYEKDRMMMMMMMKKKKKNFVFFCFLNFNSSQNINRQRLISFVVVFCFFFQDNFSLLLF